MENNYSKLHGISPDSSNPAPDNEIILYQPDSTISLNVRVEKESVWLNRKQMALLFDRDVKTIGKHIKNALQEELEGLSVIAKFATTAADGKTYQVEYYNIEMVTSVGYRVKSKRGVQFRQWANQILKEYLLRGYSINQRLLYMESRLDHRLSEHERRLNELSDKVDFFVRTSIPPVEGVFFNGQIFDAYRFVCDIVKTAKTMIVLIDNYVDESVLTLLDKRASGVKARIYTHSISKQLRLDIQRHNSQYPPIEVMAARDIHDRFLIVDETVYHIGASIKDLGKKLFAFSKMEMPAATILNNI